MARGTQHGQELRRAEETGREVHAARADVGGQPVGGAGNQRIGQQVERDRERIGRLRVLAHPSGARDELAIESRADVAEQCLVRSRVGLIAERARGARHDIRRVSKVRGGDEVGLRGGAGIRRIVAVQGEPVAKLPSGLPQQIGPGATPLELDPRTHARILPREQPAVAVGDVHRPRDDHGRVAPARGAGRIRRIGAQDIGNNPGQRAAPVLIGRDIAQPLREKSRDVEVERRGGREDLRVAGPAQPLVALRAVGRHVEEVAALAPYDILLQPVEE